MRGSTISQLNDRYADNFHSVTRDHLRQAMCDIRKQYDITGDFLLSVDCKIMGRALRVWKKINKIKGNTVAKMDL